MAGHVAIRCPSCRAFQPARRSRCEGPAAPGRRCGKNLKSLDPKDYYIVFYEHRRKLREHIGPSSNQMAAAARLNVVLKEITARKYLKPSEAMTFGEMGRTYMRRQGSKAKRERDYQRILDVELLPLWEHVPAGEVRRKDVLALLDPIADRAPVMANRVLTFIKMIYNWAVENEILEVNPVYRMKPPTKERARERVLTDQEIRTFWHGVDTPRIRPAVREALRFTLLTAQRPGEVAGAALKDLDLKEAKRWTMPDTKGGRSHTVPLSPMALEQIMSLSREGTHLFTAREGRPIAQTSMAHAIKNVDALAALAFTPHDLRRTAGTRMAEMGIPRHTISRILNHSEGGVTRIYDRYGYDKEKREALNRWADRLRQIITAKEGVSGE